MKEPFATVEDIERLYRPLTAPEQDRANALLPLISDEIRVLGRQYGKDIDARVAADESYRSVVKLVTALGYSWSGSFAVAGGGIANSIMVNDMKKLGLLRQQMGSEFLWQGCQVSV